MVNLDPFELATNKATIAWKLQANAEGDISERARRLATEIALSTDIRSSVPKIRRQPQRYVANQLWKRYRSWQSRLHRGLQSRPPQPILDGLRQNARSFRTQEYRLRAPTTQSITNLQKVSPCKKSEKPSPSVSNFLSSCFAQPKKCSEK